MSQGIVVLVGNWQRGSCPTGLTVLQGSCSWVVFPMVVVLGVVVPGALVLEPLTWL